MTAYIIRRLLWMVLVLFGVAAITFVIAFLVPGDPARLYAGTNASPAAVKIIHHQLGLDRPLWTQFGDYMWRVLHLDFGFSYRYQTPVLPAILQRFPATAELALAGVFFELIIGLPIGILSAIRPGSFWDRATMVFTFVALAAPPFWLGLLFLFFFGVVLPVLPIGGYGGGAPQYLLLPALTLGLGGAAYYARLLRASLLDILKSDYVRTAWAKGLTERQVIQKHAIPNALTVIVSQLGMDLGYFLAGVVVIETVFAWPGIGKQAVDAIFTLDIPLVMGTVLFGALLIVTANVVVDISYTFLDPRVRYN
ncbi:MAG: peptide/nickel transport system permease protein [Chloroflexota bacterium]|jgi:peptide/nickel transport system permease protein|nr:peptide/nickel transport system permease protein [Chloroflexota bacterium]MEA2667203.1 peptide/nickel transport system permease protein [Chloroflexota bacterium]